MALDDWVDDVETDSDESEDSDPEGEGKAKPSLGVIVNLVTEHAIKDNNASYEDGTITADEETVAMWFALMCLDYQEADLPKED